VLNQLELHANNLEYVKLERVYLITSGNTIFHQIFLVLFVCDIKPLWTLVNFTYHTIIRMQMQLLGFTCTMCWLSVLDTTYHILYCPFTTNGISIHRTECSFCHIHPEDGDCDVWTRVGTVAKQEVAKPRKPILHISHIWRSKSFGMLCHVDG
jgi:hypothetical protein